MQRYPQGAVRSWTIAARWLLVVAVVVLAYAGLSTGGVIDVVGDVRLLREWLADAGWMGPVAIVGLMTVAIVFSPLPSAPIALAAGALYGHTWGTLYVLTGAELGALVAFAIARYLRPPALADWLQERLSFRKFDSQHMLMLAVCASRLLPFVSFDLVSYAAGLTPLRLWRFALATLVGILPASFVLAHLGGELGSFDPARVGLSLLLLVALGALPWLARLVRRGTDRGPDAES